MNYLFFSAFLTSIKDSFSNLRSRPKFSLWQKWVWCTLNLTILLVSLNSQTLAAKRLSLSFGIIQRSITIESLAFYARTGKLNDELKTYFQYAPQEKLTELRQVLITPIPLTNVEISQFLYTPIGENLLEKLENIIQGESRGVKIRGTSRSAGFYAIRAALILAASDSKEFTILDILEKFPSNKISIDLARSLEMALEVRSLINQTRKAIKLIDKESQEEVNTNIATDISAILAANLRKPGNYNWQKRTISLVDLSRSRNFNTDIYLPEVSGESPVIVISHGLGSDRTSFVYLAKYLASHGFVVAVPEHPGSNAEQLQALLSANTDKITSPKEFIDRPLDIKYLLDKLTSLSRTDPLFKGKLNTQQVGVVGQSFGGYTALALAGAQINVEQMNKTCSSLEDSLNVSLLLQCLAYNLNQSEYNFFDPRVKVAIAINPITSSVFGRDGFNQIRIPVMIISSSLDKIAPALPEQIKPFTWLQTQNKYLALIDGGTHFSTIAESPDATVPLPSDIIGASPELAQNYIQVLSNTFFQAYVNSNANYRRYLDNGYIKTISREPLPLSIVRSLDLDRKKK